MTATYTRITLSEMKTTLESLGFEYMDMKSINDFVTNEYVFQKYIDRSGKQYTLRLYTGISKQTDDSRDCGEDAIRLVVYSAGKYFGEGRVNRTTNWQVNMKKRINTWDTLFKVCPQCGSALKERKGKFGNFYGCVTYPQCGYTEKKV
jgi:phosphoribosyl-AMP cyclohydrolase/predicted RNA-binding Zn-ribbon protein involved in translation (DUF1610 family)